MSQISTYKTGVITKKYLRTYINFEGKETYIERGLCESDPEYTAPDSILPYQWYNLPGGKGICTVHDYCFPNEKPIGYSGEYSIFICDVIPQNKFIEETKTPDDDINLLRKLIKNTDRENKKELLLYLLQLEEQDDKKTIGMTRKG